ncbi:malonyl-ACP O-methyltransferase BioC [Arsukibacterium sp.]|uniref:malonyl-ACP O-methyltransferase BioC n=1 Tax=Arsukibacterium sp. TaxID=1977258 RepID=UPI002FD8B9AB
MTKGETLFLQKVAASFGNACHSYVAAARLQQQVALEALALMPEHATGHLLDLGCGPGWIHPRFANLCQQFTAVDLSAGMLAKAASQQLAAAYVQADAEQLPLPDASVDKVFSSLMLQWCANPHAALSHIARVLTPGGQAVLTTLVAGSLLELQQAFACVDDKQHVNHFLPVNQLKATASRLNGMSWQYIERSYTLYYPDVQSLARELKALGANQVAGRQQQGLTGKGYWQKLAMAYDKTRTSEGLPATYQVLQLVGVKDGS